MIWLMKYLYPAFFNILENSCHFSDDLSTDFTFKLASITGTVRCLKELGLGSQNDQKQANCCIL